mmetsp:Transcript_4559/g.19577  ORF Transcript_4559/g.19577 Transcript_4559/m.19577 type:complete len:121 (+) Transcript_4559:503-865(+)
MNGGLGFVLGGLSRSLGANKGKGSPRFNTCASVRRGQIVSFARIPEKVQVVLKVLCCGWRSIIRDVTRVSYGLLALAICALAAPGTAHAAFQLQRRAQGSELIAEAPPAQQERKVSKSVA